MWYELKNKILQARRSTFFFLDAWKQKDIHFVHSCLAAVAVSQLLFNMQLLSSCGPALRAWLHYLGPREPIYTKWGHLAFHGAGGGPKKKLST
jgi:hypothetical protein